jgi:NitT/TauT family transport system permease protein
MSLNTSLSPAPTATASTAGPLTTKTKRTTSNVLKDIFTPNRIISPQVAKTLLFGQVVFFLLLWTFSPASLMPTPGEVYKAQMDLISFDGMIPAVISSIILSAQSIAITAVVSLALAYLSTIPFFRPGVAFIGKMRFLSMTGLSLVFTVMTSSGHGLRVSILVFSITVFFVTSMADVISGIPKEMYDLARTLGMNEWQVLYEVVILGQADKAFDVLRQNAAMGWMMLIMVEGMSREEGGIGVLLLNQNKAFHLSAVAGIQILVLGVGLLQDYLLGGLKRMVCPYADLRTEK